MKRFVILTTAIFGLIALPSCTAASGLAKAFGRTLNTAGGMIPR